MVADVDVVNFALTALGASRITALNDGSTNATPANDVYSMVRDQVLRSSDWKFASTRARLVEVSTTPAFGFSHQYALPSDWLRTVSASENDSGFGSAVVKEETFQNQRVLLSDADALYIVYVARVTDPNLFTPDFTVAFAIELAKRLAIKIPTSSTIKDNLDAEVSRLVTGAKSTDSLGQTPTRRPPGTWLQARFGWRSTWFANR